MIQGSSNTNKKHPALSHTFSEHGRRIRQSPLSTPPYLEIFPLTRRPGAGRDGVGLRERVRKDTLTLRLQPPRGKPERSTLCLPSPQTAEGIVSTPGESPRRKKRCDNTRHSPCAPGTTRNSSEPKDGLCAGKAPALQTEGARGDDLATASGTQTPVCSGHTVQGAGLARRAWRLTPEVNSGYLCPAARVPEGTRGPWSVVIRPTFANERENGALIHGCPLQTEAA